MGQDVPLPRRTEEESRAQRSPLPGASGLEYDANASYQFTMQHPMGRIFLKLIGDNTELAKKCNLKEMDCNILDISKDFHAAMLQERNDLLSKLAQNSTDIECNLIQKELNSHTINQSVEPPSNFSPVPTLISSAKLAECMRVFPCRTGSKFSGATKDHTITIMEFLSSLKTAQLQCKLSEAEFKNMLLNCTTGKAHLLLIEWIDSGESLHNIYHNLMLHFDKRITPDCAKTQLASFKANKGSTLASVEAHLMTLCNRASSAYPAGSSRTAYYNIEYCNTLANCLPPQSNIIVQTTKHSLSAKLGRAATGAELSKALNVHRQVIDADIKLHGATHNLKDRNQDSNFKPKKSWPKGSVYSVNYAKDAPQGTGTGNARINGKDRGYPTKNNNYKGGRKELQNVSGQSYNNKGNFRQGQSRSNRNSTQYGNTNYCSLCGNNDHTIAQGCPNMISDSGTIVQVYPVHGSCSICPQFVQPRLNHPTAYCPYRKGGPFATNN